MATFSPESARLSHLLRRAGFGARPAEFQAYARLGYQETLEQLLHPEKQPDILAGLLDQIGGDYVDLEDIGSIRHWWLYRMVHTNRPLEERMTLFWHNHFATANYKVDNSRRMWRQNETFRRHALGSFRTLLQEMVSDPAMLVWLDGAQNRLGKPNENFAREVMELFTLGVDGGYTEDDIKEAARAFTGWVPADTASGFRYDPFQHDDGAKTVLKRTGNWHADDVIDILVKHPATAKFLCTKLFCHFAHENPTAADINPLTRAYFDSGYEIRSVLRVLFNSPGFLGPAARFARIKSPVEFAVMTMRTLDAPMSAVRDLAGTIGAMGQELFNPPNVKGWEEGRAWINTRTLLARVNFASVLAGEMNRRVSLLERLQAFSAAETGSLGAKSPTSAGAAGPTATKPPAADTMAANTRTGNSSMGNTMMGGMSDTMMGGATAGNAMAGNTMTGGTMMDNDVMMSAMRPGGAPGTSNKPTGALGAAEAVDLLWNALLPGLPMEPATRAALLKFAGDDARWAAKLPGLLDIIVAVPEYQLC